MAALYVVGGVVRMLLQLMVLLIKSGHVRHRDTGRTFATAVAGSVASVRRRIVHEQHRHVGVCTYLSIYFILNNNNNNNKKLYK